MTDTTREGRSETCGDCPLATSRRAFLRGAALSVAAAIAASGFSPGMAFADLVAEAKPVRMWAARRSYALPARDAVLVDEEKDVIITRYRRNVYAFSRRCPHKGARLVWRESEGLIFCPKHKARFTKDGDHASGRPTRNLDRYSITLQDREIIVDMDTLYREDENPEAWRAAVVSVQ